MVVKPWAAKLVVTSVGTAREGDPRRYLKARDDGGSVGELGEEPSVEVIPLVHLLPRLPHPLLHLPHQRLHLVVRSLVRLPLSPQRFLEVYGLDAHAQLPCFQTTGDSWQCVPSLFLRESN